MYETLQDVPSALTDFYTESDVGVVIVPKPETKVIGDLERVLALGKPDNVLLKFAQCVADGEQWAWFDDYHIYLEECEKVEEYNSTLVEYPEDEEGNILEPLEYPTEPVRPLQRTAEEVLSQYYAERRKPLYPDVTEFADAYVKLHAGDSTAMDEYVEKCLAVKVQVPKE